MDIYNLNSSAIVIGQRKKSLESAKIEIGEDELVFLKKVSRKKNYIPMKHIILLTHKEKKKIINPKELKKKDISKEKGFKKLNQNNLRLFSQFILLKFKLI